MARILVFQPRGQLGYLNSNIMLRWDGHFNPRPGGGLSHLRHGGGSICENETAKEAAWHFDRKLSVSPFELLWSFVSLRSKLRPSKAKFSKKFTNYMTWLHTIRIISDPVRATSKLKKKLESSLNALSLTCPQISPKINRLGIRGHERLKTSFMGETVFDYNSSVWNDRALILTPSCLPRQGASKHAYYDLERSMSRGDPSRSYCIWIDANWRGKHNKTTFMPVALLNHKLSPKHGWWPRMTSDDL